MNRQRTFIYPYKGVSCIDELKVSEIYNIQFFEYEKEYLFASECQNFWSLLYVDQGHICINMEFRQFPLHLKKGHMILIPPNTKYNVKPSSLKRFSLFRVSFNVENPLVMESFSSNFMFPYSRYRYEIVREIIREAQRSLPYALNQISFNQFDFTKEAPFGARQMIFSHLERMLINLKRECLNDTGIPLGDESLFEGLTIVEDTVEYLKHHVFARVSLDEISEYLQISKSYLQKIFVTATGKTVMRHLRELRISEAKRLILYEDISMSEISDMLCFSSIHHFSSCFKQIEGLPPTKYYDHMRAILNGNYDGVVEV